MTRKQIAFFLFLSVVLAYSQPVLFKVPLSPRIANYDISVRLDPGSNVLQAVETIDWLNSSADPLSTLQLHLYLNAFRNDRSTYMRESRRRTDFSEWEAKNWGFIDITSLSLNSGQDLLSRMQFIQPDDGNADDRTVVSVSLPEPLPPGQRIKLTLAFEARLPEPPLDRNGAMEGYYFVSQWFPKVGVYTTNGWNCHQYHYVGEFFADFGVYDVRMTVPSRNLVGATGQLVSRQENADGTATHWYHAEDVHDFAWTTSPDFVEVNGRAQDVDIRVLMSRDHAAQAARHLRAAQLAVEFFQNTYGDYPFPNLTVVDPRRGAMNTGGMEYPTLITAGTIYAIPEGVRMPEMIIIHEFGHNYWYHLVANNEMEEAWLDEGINSYSEHQALVHIYGADHGLIDWLGLRIDPIHLHRSGYLSLPDRDPIVRNAWEFRDGNSYGVLTYDKASLALNTLHNYLGEKTMVQIMRTFLARWRFKHPHSQDFIDVANEVSGQNLDEFFRQALYSNAQLDYGIGSIQSHQVDKPVGYDYSLSTRHDSTLSGGVKPPANDSTESKKTALYKSHVLVERYGDFIFPVEIEMVFSDGDTLHERWDGRDEWVTFEYLRPARLISATVDPDHKIVLDVKMSNNSRSQQPPSLGLWRWLIRGLYALQLALDLPELSLLATGFSTMQ